MCFSSPKVSTPPPAPPPPAPEPVPQSVAPSTNEGSLNKRYASLNRKGVASYRSDLNIPGGTGSGLNVSV